MSNPEFDVLVIGSGMGALTTACLLAKNGKKVGVLEQNWLVGGCTSSYWRKGFVFESGATTLVGLDANMPLKYLVEELGIDLEAIELKLPMQVHLKDGTLIHRYKELAQWINEAERIFGKKNQRQFWQFCYQVSQFVWETSLKQTAFPPTRFADIFSCVKNLTFKQLNYAPYAFFSMQWLLKKYNLLENKPFVDFVNEQLLITAQNHISEVNVLFGATALCYTNYGNYYVNGGLINLVNPFVKYLEAKGNNIFLRHKVEKVDFDGKMYHLKVKQKGREDQIFSAPILVSGIPINNTLALFEHQDRSPNFDKNKVMESKQLNSAFQMGIGFKKTRAFDCIHHQIHLDEPLPEVSSASIFLSLSHPDDLTRADAPEMMVGSVSTHIKNPEANMTFDKQKVEQAILNILEKRGFLKKEDIAYLHSSTPTAWEKWTNRKFGFVGGYPQYLKTKPWEMIDSRLDGKGAYLCGDTTYPGQGIPGVVLSGIIAYEKLRRDKRY
jgi:C-3',4' desaturase CrtD